MTNAPNPTRPGRPRSLLWQVVLTVLVAFVAVFVLLYGLIAWDSLRRESGQLDTALLRSARGIAQALDKAPDTEAAKAFALLAQATVLSMDGDGDFAPLVAAHRLDDSQPPIGDKLPLGWQTRPEGFSTLLHDGVVHRTYAATGKSWRVVLVDDEKRRSWQIVRQLGPELAKYLALAVPIVLLPVLWAVREALRPLQQLSDRVAARAPADTTPLHMPRPYRELLPLEDALNRLFVRVGQGVAREKAFVHDAAHELRTPLAVISAQAHVLAHLPVSDDEALAGAATPSVDDARQEARQHLEAAVTRASHLTQQLLQLAQADASATAARQPVDVMNLARDSLATFARRAEEQGTELSLTGPDSAVLNSDPQALRSIIDNLVDNALRYGGPGGAVEVRCVAGGTSSGTSSGIRNGIASGAVWVLTVSDCGPGIPAPLHEQVFERFWRGSTEHQRGAGLGLAIVREAARSLGGTAQVLDNGNGPGCTVCVELPAG